MKKILLSLLLILAVTFTASAQRHKVTRTYKSKCTYTTSSPRSRGSLPYDNIGELRLHILGELGTSDLTGLFWHEMPMHYSIGAMIDYQTGRILSLGIGGEYYGTRNVPGKHTTTAFLNTVPVYANIRLNTPGTTKFFAEARVGYSFPTNFITDANNTSKAYVAKGIYTSASIGLNCYGNNLSVGFNIIDLATKTAQATIHNAIRTDIFTDFFVRYSFAFPLN